MLENTSTLRNTVRNWRFDLEKRRMGRWTNAYTFTNLEKARTLCINMFMTF